MHRFTIKQLAWTDPDAGQIDLPRGPMKIRLGFGSGLSRRPGDPEGVVWAVGDRGPNLKAKTLVKRYGLESMRALEDEKGAKIMPRLDLGPTLAKLLVQDDRVELLDTIRIAGSDGAPVSGLPIPGGEHARREPVFDLDGHPLEPDPSGLDTEGLIALGDGSFWIGDEFGPSLVRVGGDGQVQDRAVPQGHGLGGASYPVRTALPAIAANRALNRGFEAIALSADEQHLFLAFQSPLAHPDEKTGKEARHVRIWRLDPAGLSVTAQYLYELDPPQSFARDVAKGDFDGGDIKVSELMALSDGSLLVLERGSETTKIYRVTLSPSAALPESHLDPASRPTLEEISRDGGTGLIAVAKELVFSSDDAPEVAADLEGMVVLSPRRLLLVNDNDFGVEGGETSFWRIDFEEPILA